MNSRFLTTWRVAVLILLAVVAGELALALRQLSTIHRAFPSTTEVAEEIGALGEKLDLVNENLDALWDLTNEMVK